MLVSVDIIIDEIGSERLLADPPRSLRRSKVPWLTLTRHASEQSRREGWLHISDADDALAFLETSDRAPLLCCCGDTAPARLEAWRERVVFVSCESADALFVELRTYLSQVAEWLEELRGLQRDREEYLRYLEASESIIGNFITISDSAFNLIAHTPGIDPDDFASEQLVKLGHHAPETVAKFEKLDLPQTWREETRFLEIVEDSPVCAWPTVSHVFRFRRNYFLHIVMLCNRRPLTDGLLDLFTMLVHELEPAVDEAWTQRKGFSQPHDELFHMLLSGKEKDPRLLADRARILGIPTKGRFTLACVEFSAEDCISIESVAWKLVDQLSSCLVTIYESSLVLLEVQDMSGSGEKPDGFQFLRLSFLANLSAAIGESNPFGSLEELALAYAQARVAIRYRERARGSLYENAVGAEPPQLGTSHASFSDAFANYLAYANERDQAFVRTCLAQHPLSKMLDDDRENGSANARILCAYLANSCKATPTAEQLHMHRNNVIYHIRQIALKYGIDTDDANTRFELQLVAHLLQS